MPRVYVIDALAPRGGTYMAYHIGRLLAREFGYEFINVEAHKVPTRHLFTYDTLPSATISVQQMVKEATERDVLVVNPSFSDRMFGLRVAGLKICYVQSFHTFKQLDCLFNSYVAVSGAVQRFLQSVYGIQAPLIAPFINMKAVSPLPWRERAPLSFLICAKPGQEGQNRILAEWLRLEILKAAPQAKVDYLDGVLFKQGDFFRHLASYRYVVNLSIAEGFGLVPLEAMALGCVVLGLNGLAGEDFMHFRKNSMALHPRDMRKIPEIIADLIKNDELAEQISINAREDALRYTYDVFRQKWLVVLKKVIS